jgi:hypothetical protein
MLLMSFISYEEHAARYSEKYPDTASGASIVQGKAKPAREKHTLAIAPNVMAR